MRPIPAPRHPDARPMPDGDSRDWVCHPGAEQSPRHRLAPCRARLKQVLLPEGAVLQEAIAQAVADEGADGACAILDGVTLAAMSYVMPDGPIGPDHAAWYSETHQARNIRLDHGTASVGRRDGAWFMHSHAIWRDPQPGMGHLLNAQCVIGQDCTVDLWLISGARLVVAPDPETNFPLFRPEQTAPQDQPNAALLTIRPHEDLRSTIERACADLGFTNASVHGIGSLIGAEFTDAPAMSAPLSEVLILGECNLRNGICDTLRVACVDPAGAIFSGELKRGKGPVCVTFELLVLSS